MERWLPVVGFEGLYEVSDEGRVRSLTHLVPCRGGATRTVHGRIRSSAGLLKGYPAVNLSAGRRTQMRTVHVMVLEAFVGPRPTAAHEGCHGDGNPLNCRLANLRWGTKAENKSDSFAHGTAVHGERVHCAKLDRLIVQSLRSDLRSADRIARELGVDKSTVQRARSGRTWSRALSEVQ